MTQFDIAVGVHSMYTLSIFHNSRNMKHAIERTNVSWITDGQNDLAGYSGK